MTEYDKYIATMDRLEIEIDIETLDGNYERALELSYELKVLRDAHYAVYSI